MTNKALNKPIIVHTARSKHIRLLAVFCIVLLIILAIFTINFLNINKKINTTTNQETQYIDVVNKVRNSVVSIRTEKTAASGIIIRNDGYILTNYHVIADIQKNDKIQVLLPDKRIYAAQVVGTDDKADVALLRVNATKLPTMEFGDSDALKVGEKVIAIGNPFGFDSTVTSGIVSAIHRDRGPTEYKDFIQTDASINPGNSGGPLIDTLGKVIGLNTFIVGGERFAGLGFAISINLVKRITDQLLEDGKVTRAFLGVTVQDLLELDKNGNGMILDGSKVIAVVNNTPASAAGLKPNDIITEINRVKVTSSNQLRNYVAWLPIDKEVKVIVLRNNQTITLSLTLKEKPNTKEEANSTIEK